MKKAILITLFITAGLPALAQISKGNVLVGGSASGSWSKTGSNMSSVFPTSSWQATISPNIGYFVTKGLAIGAVTSYSAGRSRTNGAQVLPDGTKYRYNTRSHDFMLGPSIQYYVMLGEKLALFAQTSLVWGRGVNRITFPETGSGGSTSVVTRSSVNRSRTFSVGPGLAYFLNPHIALLGGLSYRNYNTKQEESELTSASTYNTNGVNLNVGVQVFMGQ